MRSKLLFVGSLCLLLSACETDRTGKLPSDVTNTGRNVRDRNNQTLTAGDQKEDELDRTITQKIRQAVVADEALSTNAKNIKIITINGVVTLRGPVNNEGERENISRKAGAVSGVRNVENLLEVIRIENARDR